MYDLDFENERLIARSACWVKNLVEAPLTFQKDKIEEDHQPVLPSMFVDEDMDIKPWNEAELEIVWSKEGHIAGLLHNDEIVCVIPSWADGHNFPGLCAVCEGKQYGCVEAEGCQSHGGTDTGREGFLETGI